MTDLINYTLIYPDVDGVELTSVKEGGLSPDKFYRASIVIDNTHGEIVKNRYGKTSLDALSDSANLMDSPDKLTISLSKAQAASLIKKLL